MTAVIGLDFTYVGDLVNGVVKVIENEKARGETFNLTYGEGRSIKQLSEVLKDHFPKLEIKSKTRDKLMPSRGTLSVEKAQKILGYKPCYPIDIGFNNYIDWYKSRAAEKRSNSYL